MKPVLAGFVIAFALAAIGSAGAARPESSSCALDVGAPFLYADLVFAPATVACAGSQNRITVTTVLTRDGVEVARNTRHCSHTATCHNDVGSFAVDEPGDQRWCTTAWGTVHGTSFAPVTRCESEPF